MFGKMVGKMVKKGGANSAGQVRYVGKRGGFGMAVGRAGAKVDRGPRIGKVAVKAWGGGGGKGFGGLAKKIVKAAGAKGAGSARVAKRAAVGGLSGAGKSKGKQIGKRPVAGGGAGIPTIISEPARRRGAGSNLGGARKGRGIGL